jgi:putative transposase
MRDWPHSPLHRLAYPGTYCVTGATYEKRPIFRGAHRLEYLSDTFLAVCEKHQWSLQAWAVFPNHYHFVAASPANAATLTPFTKEFHSLTAIQANRWDQVVGRQVWYQYWETELTYPASYFARLSYVHRNAVHHGIVREPSLYAWCSAGWFERRADTSFYKRIMTMKIDRVKIDDEFEVDPRDL